MNKKLVESLFTHKDEERLKEVCEELGKEADHILNNLDRYLHDIT
ncbi:hypothetical protein [Anaerosinus sp.]